MSPLYPTAGLAMYENVGRRCGSGCRCPISNPRPDLETRRKTAHRSFDNFLKKIVYMVAVVGPAKSVVSRLILE